MTRPPPDRGDAPDGVAPGPVMADPAASARLACPGPVLAIAAVDHASYTVPDLDAAETFFVGVLGAVVRYRRQSGPLDRQAAARLGVAPSTSFRLAKLDLAGMPLELFEYREPGAAGRPVRNAEPGGGHLGLTVVAFDEAVERLRAVPGVRLLGEGSVLPPDHPLAGRRWIYFLTPWGLQLELVSQIP